MTCLPQWKNDLFQFHISEPCLQQVNYYAERECNIQKKRPIPYNRNWPFSFPIVLSTETKLLNDASVSLDVNFLEVVQQLTSFTYETEKRATCNHIFLVLLYVLCKVIDTVGK